MKYTYTRKELYNLIKNIRNWRDIGYINENLLLSTVYNPKEDIGESNEKSYNPMGDYNPVEEFEKVMKSVKKTNKIIDDIAGHEPTGIFASKADKECTTCGCLKKSSPTPDGDEICPDCGGDCLDYEPKFEEIEEIRQDTLSEYISHQSLATAINSLIRNQKKLYQLIKEKL